MYLDRTAHSVDCPQCGNRGPVDADGAVDAQTAPTAPWKTLRVSHKLPQGLLSTKSPTDRLNHPQILLRNRIGKR